MMMNNKSITYKGGKLHKGQKKIVKNILKTNNKFTIVNSSRQAGKSYMLIQLILYYAINYPKKNLLVISPFNSQNLKIFKDLLRGIESSGIVKSANKSEHIIELINGSQIIFKSTENFAAIRGITSDYVFCDEFAFFKKEAWEEAIQPTMTARKKSRAFIFSTPRGKNDFYKLAMLGMNPNEKQYQYYFMSYKDNPYYDVSFVRNCKKHYPKDKYEQEFEGKFVDSSSVFDYEECAVIDAYMEPEEGMTYYAGLDLARKKDMTVLTIQDEDGNTVLIYAINGTKWSTIVTNVVQLLKKYNNAECLIEVNSIGDVVYELIAEEYEYITPIFTQNTNKQEYIEELIYAFNNVDITIPTKELLPELHLQLDVFEMSFSEKSRKTVYAARTGYHDDYIISLALANHHRFENEGGGDTSIYVDGIKI